MKGLWAGTLGAAGLLTAGIAATLGHFYVRQPVVAAPPAVEVEITPERIARGEYLFRLADCDGCHSERDFGRFGGPVISTGRGKGVIFPPELGLPGRVVAPNITPDRETGIGSWTDGEKVRAIREGIGRDGRPLFPMMPYESYRHMSDEDVWSLVAYLDTLKPVKNALPRTRIDFPASMLMRAAPAPVRKVAAVDPRDRIRYGQYLATLGGCQGCHTPSEKGRPRPGMLFAGGQRFRLPFATVVSANITPDPATGIGGWTEQAFLDHFYQYSEYARNGPPKVGPDGFTLMPWLNLSQLPPEDLKAIYRYLRTLPPVHHPVEIHPVELQAD